MPIHILVPEVVSKIAAGEVVERPASVVKELVENSLDAAATQITIEVNGGGVRLIRVMDNGAGIPSTEVKKAFERYATSKVGTVTDLDNISTLGFRGEALPSIAAVSEVTLISRTSDEIAGTYIRLKDGVPVEKGPRGCPQGASVTVSNLFRNVPARLKFLKSQSTENSHISHLVSQYSLAFPEVRFVLSIDGRATLHTPGTGNLRDSLIQVYGLDVAQAMLEVAADTDTALKVSGLVSPPSLSRSNRSYLSFFVNRRWVQSRMLAYAVEEAYHGMLMTGKHPVAVINIGLPPQEIDVNVHPTKTEVRFRRDRVVFSAVQKAVRTALVNMAPIPPLRVEPKATVFPSATKPAPVFDIQAPKPAALPDTTKPLAKPSVPILRVLGQLDNSYVVAEGPDGMYLIDQHAAHERVLFEKLQAEWERKAVEVQGLLEPLTIELTTHHEGLLKDHKGTLAEYGFDIEPFGERTYRVRSVPALLKGENLAESLIEVLDFLAEETTSNRQERLAIALACHSAVRAGQILSHEEMTGLIRQLEATTSPHTCPHGRPTMIHLSSSRLAKEFGRR